jgi:hypothetical protein
MPSALVLLLTLAALITIALLARRDARAATMARNSILDPALSVFDKPELSFDVSGFPRIEGLLEGRAFRVALIPDTLTIRRLPQLWLAVTLKRSLPFVRGSVAVLIRPSGSDYYSLTERMSEQLPLPDGFPEECLIKGEGAGARATLDRIAPCAAALFSDPKVKELVVSNRGVRIVRQVAEGKRGEHLLLRQSVFEGARLEAQELQTVVDAITRIENVLLRPDLVSAA